MLIARPVQVTFSRSSTLFVLFTLLLLAERPVRVEGSMRLCGQRLTRTLMALCRNQICGAFVGAPVIKRSMSWSPEAKDFPEVHHQAKRAGIATECCEKRCTYTYLKTYCCNDQE